MGGHHRVTIGRYGTRTARRSEVFLHYGLYGEPDSPIEMDYFVWVVQDASESVIVDTGFSARGGARRGRTLLHHPARVFELLGVEPEAAPPVVVTHAHYDHIGNLELFPRSTIYIARREFEFWTGPHASRGLFRHLVDEEDIASLCRAADEGRLHAFEGSLTLRPGIEIIEFGGHTPGMSAVIVETDDGGVLIASDVVHYHEELVRDRPFAHVTDVVGSYAALDRVRELSASGAIAHVLPGHDPDTLNQFPSLEGDLSGIACAIGSIG